MEIVKSAKGLIEDGVLLVNRRYHLGDMGKGELGETIRVQEIERALRGHLKSLAAIRLCLRD